MIIKEIDARGLPCPQPVVVTKKALEEMGEGTVIVLVDSVESRENVRRFARSQGCQVQVAERDGVFRINVARGQPVQAERKKSSDVIFITTDRLGTGDEKLGGMLMEAFLSTLCDAETKPARIVFINDGVRLAAEGSEVLEALHLLEQEGVEMFSCGTCLEYYRLKDKLRAGQVTNMFDIVDSLLKAGKVIKI